MFKHVNVFAGGCLATFSRTSVAIDGLDHGFVKPIVCDWCWPPSHRRISRRTKEPAWSEPDLGGVSSCTPREPSETRGWPPTSTVGSCGRWRHWCECSELRPRRSACFRWSSSCWSPTSRPSIWAAEYLLQTKGMMSSLLPLAFLFVSGFPWLPAIKRMRKTSAAGNVSPDVINKYWSFPSFWIDLLWCLSGTLCGSWTVVSWWLFFFFTVKIIEITSAEDKTWNLKWRCSFFQHKQALRRPSSSSWRAITWHSWKNNKFSNAWYFQIVLQAPWGELRD